MKSLLPIISYEGGYYTAILVHAQDLANKIGNETFLKVAKTSTLVHPGDEWEFLLLDERHQVTLLSSDDIKVNSPTRIDLIDILGHQISLAHWQVLALRTNVDRGLYLTYLADV